MVFGSVVRAGNLVVTTTRLCSANLVSPPCYRLNKTLIPYSTRHITTLKPSLCDSNRLTNSTDHDNIHITQSNRGMLSNLIIKRFKTKPTKKPKTREEILSGAADDEEEDDDDDSLEENPLLDDDDIVADSGGTTLLIDVSSLRLDSIASKALAVTRLKIDEAFYQGNLLLNGERPAKKNMNIAKGDEIVLVLGQSPDEKEKLYKVKRAQLVRLPDKMDQQGRMKIEVTTEITEMELNREEL